ncbi:hypothetical protein PF005_g28592 [Phytophthora fragariae]|nr:hypothetical protein PF003_g34274 [Phytophthora fragariae]KAE8917127.1 hypothetical protein PF009_g32552 [Phytophthora fragariae]KAE9069255.1 hypothetical protein PF007_g27387 [Phytophthora fragariae]KAE9076429.1 hypothetical protein PF006_g28134 [Phytophthora fragariae]KAE9167923.1 hypothetical protein PF005_g28592 [Phytophthora fragariae]
MPFLFGLSSDYFVALLSSTLFQATGQKGGVPGSSSTTTRCWAICWRSTSTQWIIHRFVRCSASRSQL